jgi:crotonobetainyl-CoA:carnitine CoA-transferase CaiB-like acyl-CoA transferase
VVEVGSGEEAVPLIRHPIGFSRTPARHELPPPTLGQDNEQIRAWLGQARGLELEERKTGRTTPNLPS